MTGDSRMAYALLAALLPDLVRVLGPDHPDTLSTEYNLSQRSAELGRHGEAVTLAEQVVATRTRVSGPDHPETLRAKSWLDNFRSWPAEPA